MKKIIFAFVTCTLTMLASAQKITDKDLQGSWKLTTLMTTGITLDVASGKISYSKETEITTPPTTLETIKDNIKQYGESLKDTSINISGNDIAQTMGGKTKTGTFTIKNHEKIQTLATKYNDGTTNEVPVKIINGQLHVTNHKNKQELIYSRE